jgi:hypothetical protein
MRKNKDRTPALRNEGHPTKPALSRSGKPRLAEGLSYEGKNKTSRMPPRSAKGGAVKTPFRAGSLRPPGKPVETSWPDQIARPGPKSESGRTAEQYIRIRVRVHNDRLTVLDSHLVGGPLAMPKQFSGSNAYEVTLNGRLLHAEALPDLGIQRSFANLSGPKEQHGHYITERPIFDFMVRVPAKEVTAETIGKMTVRLYRLKEEVRTARLDTATLADQFEREVREVAELVGLPKSVLPEAIASRGGQTPAI